MRRSASYAIEPIKMPPPSLSSDIYENLKRCSSPSRENLLSASVRVKGAIKGCTEGQLGVTYRHLTMKVALFVLSSALAVLGQGTQNLSNKNAICKC